MWCILEGPDGAGKTTLARDLERAAPGGYRHAGPTDQLPVLARRMFDDCPLYHEVDVVWDRAHLGNHVYGLLDRGGSDWRDSGHAWRIALEAFLIDRGAHCYFMTADISVLRRRKPDESYERLVSQLGYFEEAMEASFLDWGVLDGGQPIGRDEIDTTDAGPSPDPLGIGTREPKVWVLGEQLSSKSPGNMDWPFLTRSGLDLVWPVVNPNYVRVSNALWGPGQEALGVNGRGLLWRRWEALGFPAVVALGRVAAEACEAAGVQIVTELSHPQWHARFRAKDPNGYRFQLAQELGLLCA